MAPEEPVMGFEVWARMLRHQDCKLLTKCEVLQDEVTARPKTTTQRYEESPQYHSHETGYIIENTDQMEFWRGTG